jgi:multisubunit Na+/H+ antiporter MnhG subunit
MNLTLHLLCVIATMIVGLFLALWAACFGAIAIGRLLEEYRRVHGGTRSA